jgi:hypothetical protein
VHHLRAELHVPAYVCVATRVAVSSRSTADHRLALKARLATDDRLPVVVLRRIQETPLLIFTCCAAVQE